MTRATEQKLEELKRSIEDRFDKQKDLLKRNYKRDMFSSF